MKGILFKPDMRQAIIELRKTQTRRLMRPATAAEFAHCKCEAPDWRGQKIDWVDWKYEGQIGYFCHKCGVGLHAYDEWSSHGVLAEYEPNEIAYIREPHYAYGKWIIDDFLPSGAPRWCFEASEYVPAIFDDNPKPIDPPFVVLKGHGDEGWYKRSPLFLPAVYARRFIRVGSVKPQCLWDITQDDALAEGVTRSMASQLGLSVPVSEEEFNLTAARRTYAALWDSINAKRGHPWSKNEGVWAYTFKLVPRPATY